MSVRGLPMCACCGRDFTVADVVAKTIAIDRPFAERDLRPVRGVSAASVRAYLAGDLLVSEVAGDRRNRLLDRIIEAIEELRA